MNKAMRRVVTGAAAVLVTGGTLAAPAMAWSWTDMGGRVDVSGRTITLTDTAADDRFVSTEYRYNGGASSGGLSNKNGYGTSTSVTQSSDITNAKICRSNGILPMDCGRWYY